MTENNRISNRRRFGLADKKKIVSNSSIIVAYLKYSLFYCTVIVFRKIIFPNGKLSKSTIQIARFVFSYFGIVRLHRYFIECRMIHFSDSIEYL